LWDSSGIFIDTIYDGGGLSRNRLATTRTGSSFLGWDNLIDANRKAYGHIIASPGIPLIDSPFVMNSPSLDQWTPEVILSDSETAIYLWRDYGQSPSLLNVQRFDLHADKLWDSMGVTVSTPSLSYTKLITDGNGGCIVAGSGENFSIRIQQISKYGTLGEIITSVGNLEWTVPSQNPVLYQNYPNPFNSTTSIRYDVPSKTPIRLEIFNSSGQWINTLVDRVQDLGSYTVDFESRNLPSGIYFYRLQTNNAALVRKLTILR
jgi:hypothetical protein